LGCSKLFGSKIMNWLITGGCGFLGTALVKRLVKKGEHNIRIIDNLSTGTKADLGLVSEFNELGNCDIYASPNGVELVVGDILDEQLAIQATRGFDVIVHLAANTGVGPSVEDPRGDMVTNIIGTFNYLEASRKNNVSKFIFASSGELMGTVPFYLKTTYYFPYFF